MPPSNPPTVADLEAEVAGQCGVALAEVGLYLRDVDGGGVPITPAIRQGLRDGALAVGLYIANPTALTDPDLPNLSPFALKRVRAEGLLFALRQVLLHWHRAVQRQLDPVAPQPAAGGWLEVERRAIERRVSELRAICEQPYREPADPMVVATPPPGWPSPEQQRAAPGPWWH